MSEIVRVAPGQIKKGDRIKHAGSEVEVLHVTRLTNSLGGRPIYRFNIGRDYDRSTNYVYYSEWLDVVLRYDKEPTQP